MHEVMRNPEAALEERLGHKFSNRGLLDRALTHSSAIPELRGASADAPGDSTHLSDNERLEFLGDAVLELLASEYLLAAFPDWSEGQLSKSRARIVNASSLESAARRLHLGEHLRLGRGEEKTGGREKQTLLADAFEAVVAAVYLDSGLSAARELLQRVLFEQALEGRGERIAESDRKSGCKNFCKGEGKRRQSIAWRERAGRIIKRLSRSKFGLTGNAWRGARAARKKRRSSGRLAARWNNSS